MKQNKGGNYVANSISKSRQVYTPFLEYALWFENKEDAEKYRLKDSEWIDSCYKWWEVWENEKYEENLHKI